jgi:16S rRNA (cytosine967-C5)-methyltransferase
MTAAEPAPAADFTVRDARTATVLVLERVLDQGAYSQKALDQTLRRMQAHPREKALTTWLVYGTLGWRLTVDAQLNARLHRGLDSLPPRLRHVLRLAAFQLGWMRDRVPPRAVVHWAAEQARSQGGPRLVGVLNAVLRRLADAPPWTPPPADASADTWAEGWGLPRWIADLLHETLPGDRAESVAHAWMEPGHVHVRARPGAGEAPVLWQPHPRVPGAWRLPRAEEVALPEGWTVQDAGAQLAGLALPADLEGPILDACAGLGMKTRHLLDRHPRARVVATDRDARKLAVLSREETTDRLGVEAWDASTPAPAGVVAQGPFEAVLVDAPCTGLGTLGRHPEVRWNRSPDDGTALAALQGQILDSALPLVRPGGWLLYVVCTWTPAETTGVVHGFLARHAGRVVVAPPDASSADAGVSWDGLVDASGAITLWPDVAQTEGFYLVRMRRTG